MKYMKTVFLVTFFLLGITQFNFGQKSKFFRTIDEIESVEPDSVYQIIIDCKETVAPDLSKYSSYKNISYISLFNFGENSIPEWLFQFKNLSHLELIGSSFYKDGSGYLSPLNNLTGISKLKNLKYLSIGWTNISELPDEIFENNNLEFLFIAGSKISSLSKITEWTQKNNKSIGLEWHYEQFNSKEDIKILKNLESGSTQLGGGAVPKKSYRTYYFSN